MVDSTRLSSVDRRSFLATVAGGSVMAAAGCLDDEVEIPDDAVEELPDPRLSAADAGEDVPVIEAFEDFACPPCADYQPTATEVINTIVNSGDAAYVHQDFVVPANDAWSWEIAEAARSVQDRGGVTDFFNFKRLMYSQQSEYSEDVVETTAEQLELDGAGVVADMNNHKYRLVVENSSDRSSDRGVTSTPTVMVDSEEVETTFEAIQAAVENA